MDVRTLQKKSDKELINSYEKIREYLIANSDNDFTSLDDFDGWVNGFLGQYYGRARLNVKKLMIAISELKRVCSKVHVHETDETRDWSSMEQTIFCTTDKSLIERIIESSFNK